MLTFMSILLHRTTENVVLSVPQDDVCWCLRVGVEWFSAEPLSV